MRRKILITSALPYANGPLHFGHLAGAYLPADCYARFQRLKGSDVLYLCGSDEYGVAIALSAEIAKRTPQQHVDEFHKSHQSFFKRLGMSFDYYGRTTSATHTRTVQAFFEVLKGKGLVEEQEQNHLYSPEEGRFLADRYVVGTCPKCGFTEARGDECQRCAASYEAIDLKNPRSKLKGTPLILKPSRHLYYRFDRFKERLKEWIQGKQWKENVTHFALRYVEELRERAITRDSDWGIPVPGMPNKVFYVWFDAPIGYISIAQQWDSKRWKDYWLDPKTELVHFIGKDNIPFHAVFFPAMLMGQDLPYKLPDEIPSNEFYLLEGRQFSKSDGWTIDMESFLQKYTADMLRYSIAANAPETADSNFSWKDFQMRCNAELLGKFGNFIHRVLTFAHQHCEGKVPKAPLDRKFMDDIARQLEKIAEAYDRFHLRKATQLLMELAHLGNVYFDQEKPWQTAKVDSARMQQAIASSIQCIQALALAASPIIPEAAEIIWEKLGHDTPLARGNWDTIAKTAVPAGQTLGQPQILFRKIEDQEMEEQLKELKPPLLVGIVQIKSLVDIEHFRALDLRVAQITHAERIPKSKKLLKLTVDLGFETRTIVSGIAHVHEPETLLGKKVVIVANLAPATLMGVESRGMLLVAGESLSLLEVPSAALGSPVS